MCVKFMRDYKFYSSIRLYVARLYIRYPMTFALQYTTMYVSIRTQHNPPPPRRYFMQKLFDIVIHIQKEKYFIIRLGDLSLDFDTVN